MKIAFYKGRARLFNRIVSWLTIGPYSHCEAVVSEHPDGTVTCWSSSFQDKGVRQKTMALNPANWDVLEVPADMAAVTAWFEDHEGAPYDWLGLVGFIFRPLTTGKVGHTFCSESLCEAMGMPHAWRYDPNTLFAICQFTGVKS